MAETNPDPRDDRNDAEQLHAYAVELADGIERALAPWVVRSVTRLLDAYTQAGGELASHDEVLARASVAGAECAAVIGPAVRAELMKDIDDQHANPLSIVRRGVTYPTRVLQAAGVPGIVRDAQAEEHFPDDDYDLVPTSFADLDPTLHDIGLQWGAAKAHIHLRRRHADGQR